MSAYIHGWHPGEIAVQQSMGFDKAMIGVYMHIDNQMPEQHQIFHQGLAYISVTTLDDKGRPWASLLTSKSGEPGFIKVLNEGTLLIDADVWAGDPIRNTAAPGGLIAGLGVMFENRRRNKFAGRIRETSKSGDRIKMLVDVDETIGWVSSHV
jgi:predicted pyridoxine 5'-phosphate oxidase superfamily flavin-nucleotide-binding protein